jgi:hypothetical protein
VTNYYLLLTARCVESSTDYICMHEHEVFDSMAGTDLCTQKAIYVQIRQLSST